MDINIPQIVILSGYSVRAKSLADMIQSSVDVNCNISTIHPADLKIHKQEGKKPLILLDLMGCQQPPHQIISTLKTTIKDAKIIALHIYRNKSLIEPIISAGVDGYLFYEPSRSELAAALKTVQNGNAFTSANINA